MEIESLKNKLIAATRLIERACMAGIDIVGWFPVNGEWFTDGSKKALSEMRETIFALDQWLKENR